MAEAMNISVAMTTYNGEKYLMEQLQSISRQEQLPAELVVCDDGSTDRTIEILREFASCSPFPVRVYVNENNLGYSENFLKSVSLCRGDFIAFCDQDDVWLPSKIRNVCECIERYPKTQLILQKSYICNERLEWSGRIFPNTIPAGNYGKHSQFGFWVWPGFLQTFRASLLDSKTLIGRPRSYYALEKSLTHDKLTCLLANALGGIVVLHEPVALYRRHSHTVTGNYAVQSLRQRLRKSLPVGSDHYVFLAEVAVETSGYLKRLAENCDHERGSNWIASASLFDKLSSIQAARADLYCATGVTGRLGRYADIVRLGGYVGPQMIALGWKSAAKDLLCVLGLLECRSQ